MSARRSPAAESLAVARYDHCDCDDCGGSGYLDVVEVVERSEGYGHIEKYAAKNSYQCFACLGRGKKACWHKAEEQPSAGTVTCPDREPHERHWYVVRADGITYAQGYCDGPKQD